MTNKELQDKLRKINCEFWSVLMHATKEQKEFYGIESSQGGVVGSDGYLICEAYHLRFTLVPDDKEYEELLEENEKIVKQRN